MDGIVSTHICQVLQVFMENFEYDGLFGKIWKYNSISPGCKNESPPIRYFKEQRLIELQNESKRVKAEILDIKIHAQDIQIKTLRTKIFITIGVFQIVIFCKGKRFWNQRFLNNFIPDRRGGHHSTAETKSQAAECHFYR